MGADANAPGNAVVNVLVVGIGGQGVMTAAEVIATAALAAGHDVKKTEVAGMAQRGGVVSSQVRFGPRVLSPVIVPGSADLLVAFEAAEGLRWGPHLRPGGLALVNTARVLPLVVTGGLFEYPEDPIATLRAGGVRVLELDATAIAADLGEVRLANTVMLGAAADHLPLDAATIERCVVERFRARKPALAELNAKAFHRGRQAAAGT